MVPGFGNDVLARAQAGQSPPDWTVLRARTGFFVGYIILGLFLIVFAIGAAFLVARDPNHVFVLTSIADTDTSPLDPTSFARWRIADLIGIAIVGIVGLITFARFLFGLVNRDQSLLVITPEGFATNVRGTKAYTFASIQHIKGSANRTQATLNFTMQPGINPARARVVIDGRFGRPSSVANMIVTASNRAVQRQ